MARLPKVGDDKGTWGDILNDFLTQSHAADGTLKANTVGAPQLRPGSVTNAAVGDGGLAQAKVAGLTDALAAKADAAGVVTLTGPQTIAGDKDFTGQLSQDGNAVVTTVDGRLNDQRVPVDGSVTTSKLAAGAVTTAAISDGQVTIAKLQGAGSVNGIATLDGTGTLPETQVPARLSDGALSSTIGEVTTEKVAASALPTSAPPTVLLRHDFAKAANTAAGGIGTPDVGPGGAWIVTGPGAASARILNGQFISPTGGVTYAYKVLASVPDVIIARNVWSAASGPTIGLMDQSVLDTTTMNGPHIQTSKTAMNPFVFVGGTNGTLRPPERPPLDSPVLNLQDGVEYETRVDIKRATGVYVTTVTRVSDGEVMGTYTAYESALSTLLGAGPYALFIEPGAGVGYTYIEAYRTSKPQVTPPVRASGGFSGPVGVDNPDAGFFDRVGAGTKTPSARIHIVGSTAAGGSEIVESSHSGGAFVRVKSTAAGADSVIHLQRNNEADSATTIARVKSTAAGMALGFAAGDVLLISRSNGDVSLVPPTNNNGRLYITGNGTGTTAALMLQANGVATASRVYGAAAASDLRLATNGADRVIITSTGAVNILGALDHDGTTVGFYGTTPVAKQTLAAAATDTATTQSLVNDIRAKLVALGLVS